MAVQPEFQFLRNDCKKQTGKVQAVVEGKINCPKDIARVISVNADSSVLSYEVLNGEVALNGRVNFKVLILDTFGDVQCLDYNADFEEKIKDDNIKSYCKPYVHTCITDTEIVSVNSSKITIAAVVENSVDCVCSMELNYLSGGEGLLIQKEHALTNVLVGNSNEIITQSEEVSIKDSVKDILYCEGRVVIDNVESLNDAISVSGFMFADICYTYSNEYVGVKNMCAEIPFNQEIQIESVETGDKVCANALLKNIKAVIDEDFGEKDNTVKINTDILLSASVYRESDSEVVNDAFSLSNEIALTGETLQYNRFLFPFYSAHSVDGSATLEEELPSIAKIECCCGSRVNIANIIAGNGTVTVEGVVNTGVIYNSFEENGLNSVEVELPFSVNMNAKDVLDCHKITGRAIVSDISAKQRKGREVDITAMLKFEFNVDNQSSVYGITAIEEKEPLAFEKPAISIIFAKEGQTPWDIAKKIKIEPSKIKAGNGETFKENEKIIVYRQLV